MKRVSGLSLIQKREGAMRESGIELLRIILMLQVVFLHICDYGEYSVYPPDKGGVDCLVYWIMMFMSRTTVYVYIALTGYFSVSSKSNQSLRSVLQKVKKIYLPMLFFSITIPLIMWGTGQEAFSLSDLISAFLPVLSRTWYFMTLYIIVLILSPFVNRCINNLSKREYTVLIAILFFIFCIWDMLANLPPIDEVINLEKVIDTDSGKSLYGVLFMYILGGYLRLNVKSYDKPRLIYLIAFVALALLNTALVYIIPDYTKVVFYNDNPISVIQGVCLVLFFRDLRFKSRVVNHIAALNLGVYMIHEHPMVRDFIWDKVFGFTQEEAFYTSFPLYVFEALGICLLVFTVSAVLEQVRRGLWAAAGRLRRCGLRQ